MRLPDNYTPLLSLAETEKAIDHIKERFPILLGNALHLTRASAPLFVDPTTGLNDNLNGVERPVSFDIKAIPGVNAEVVQSLAKWKRFALKRYGIPPHAGIYTDMNAIRRDEDLDPIHSLYVDQWDWEQVILPEDRNIAYLEKTVRFIYGALAAMEKECLPLLKSQQIEPLLPPEISFIDSEELRKAYPGKSPKEREYLICQEKKAVFVERIGGALGDGKPHDGRAPDYDDWSLNGDILVYYPVLDIALELSSMGIRVNAESLKKQLVLSHQERRENLPFQQAVLHSQLPLSIGGGIGQSRLCLFYLRKAHIGEVQASLWDEKTLNDCEKSHIVLL